MAQIFIESYRGFEIFFDTTTGKFSSACSDNNSKESTSFPAVKKFIDDYKKANQPFEPFWVEVLPQYAGCFTTNKIKIVGVRKDGLLIYEDTEGRKLIFGDYNKTRYMLINPDNAPILEKIEELERKKEELIAEIAESRRQLYSELKIQTLGDFIDNL